MFVLVGTTVLLLFAMQESNNRCTEIFFLIQFYTLCYMKLIACLFFCPPCALIHSETNFAICTSNFHVKIRLSLSVTKFKRSCTVKSQELKKFDCSQEGKG